MRGRDCSGKLAQRGRKRGNLRILCVVRVPHCHFSLPRNLSFNLRCGGAMRIAILDSTTLGQTPAPCPAMCGNENFPRLTHNPTWCGWCPLGRGRHEKVHSRGFHGVADCVPRGGTSLLYSSCPGLVLSKKARSYSIRPSIRPSVHSFDICQVPTACQALF